jgi:hypothetical protein
MVYEISSIKTRKNDYRISKLKQIDDEFDYTGLSYPVSFEDIKLFENNNNKIAVFVYYINDENIIAKENMEILNTEIILYIY